MQYKKYSSEPTIKFIIIKDTKNLLVLFIMNSYNLALNIWVILRWLLCKD